MPEPDDIVSWRDLKPGEIFKNDRGKWLIFRCPRKGHQCQISIRPQRNASGASWDVSGEEGAPTVSPSINCGGCGWHGFIRNGEFSDA